MLPFICLGSQTVKDLADDCIKPAFTTTINNNNNDNNNNNNNNGKDNNNNSNNDKSSNNDNNNKIIIIIISWFPKTRKYWVDFQQRTFSSHGERDPL